MSFSVRVEGDQAVRRALRKWMNPELRKRLQVATGEGAKVFKAPMKAEAAPVSKRLARSVSARRAARETPASVVTFRPKVAFFRHFIVGGTHDHGPRKAAFLVFVPGFNQYSGASSHGVGNKLIRVRKVSGVKPNPIPQRVFERMVGAASRAVTASLEKERP